MEPVIKETERMVYVAFSEYFFDSAMHAYFQAGVLAIELQGEKVKQCRTPDYTRQLPAGRQEGGLGSAHTADEGTALLGQQRLLTQPWGVCPPCRCPRT